MEDTFIINNPIDLVLALDGEELETVEEAKVRAERRIYKDTDCGAWIEFKDTGIALGSIVEGAEATVGPEELIYPFTKKQLEDTLEGIESAVSQIVDEMETELCNRCGQSVEDDGICPNCGMNNDSVMG